MKKYDYLVVFGRGAQEGPLGWEPTGPIELTTEGGGHTGKKVADLDMNSDDPRNVIAGAGMNVEAASILYKELRQAGEPPLKVVFAAGRPAYLANAPSHVTEGSALRKVFEATTDLDESTEIQMQATNRNTRDDLIQTLKAALETGLLRICIISVLVHLPRCHEFYLKALETNPEFHRCSVDFVASEMVIWEHYPERRQEVGDLLVSRAYERTAQRERKGIGDIRDNKYDFGDKK
ncbi:MAG: hypothetical protein AAB691_03820 [Patescibacteria group bacterium]